jgi:hypothetical protein
VIATLLADALRITVLCWHGWAPRPALLAAANMRMRVSSFRGSSQVVTAAWQWPQIGYVNFPRARYLPKTDS